MGQPYLGIICTLLIKGNFVVLWSDPRLVEYLLWGSYCTHVQHIDDHTLCTVLQDSTVQHQLYTVCRCARIIVHTAVQQHTAQYTTHTVSYSRLEYTVVQYSILCTTAALVQYNILYRLYRRYSVVLYYHSTEYTVQYVHTV